MLGFTGDRAVWRVSEENAAHEQGGRKTQTSASNSALKEVVIAETVAKQQSHESTLSPERGIRLRSMWAEKGMIILSTSTRAERTLTVRAQRDGDVRGKLKKP